MRILINIDVPDLTPAIDFYCQALDLRHTRTLDDDVAELSGGDCIIYLLQKPAGSVAVNATAEPRRYSRHWTPVHVDFVVTGIEQAVERALKAGAKRESACIDWKLSHCVSLSDPFGNGFCLIEFDRDTYLEPD